jgi:D-sedoheptulose 7-phosphate isomerase
MNVGPIVDDYVAVLARVVRDVDGAALDRFAGELHAARRRGSTVFVAGNGGSASTASHWAHDLGRSTRLETGGRLRACALTDNVTQLTAVANDYGYAHIFEQRLAQLARHGDVLVAISASGSSENLIRAVEFATTHGLVTAALVGFDGGALKDQVDHCLWVRSEPGAYGLVESAHSILCDILSTCILADLPGAAVAPTPE